MKTDAATDVVSDVETNQAVDQAVDQAVELTATDAIANNGNSIGEEKEPKKRLFSNRDLVRLIIPLLIEQFLAMSVGLADSIMIANVGEAAVSGVSLVDCVMVLIIQVFAALASGGAVVAGQYLGLRKPENASKSAHQLLWSTTIIAVIVTGIFYACNWFILHKVFGEIADDVMLNAKIYFMICAASIPFIALYNGGAAIFRAMGDSKTSMIVSIIMNVINVGGNAILIYGFKCGAEGVAIPTLVSRMVAGILMVVLLRNPKRILHLPKGVRYRPDWKIIKSILRIGVPNGVENGMFQFGKIVVMSLVSTFGTCAIAANAVSGSIACFQILPGSAMSLAIITVVSRCIGAGDIKQARFYVRKMMLITYVGMAISIASILASMSWLMDIYNLSQETAETTMKLLTLHGLCGAIIWPASFTLPNVFRAAGDVKFSMVVSMISMWVFRILFSFIFGRMLGWGVVGVWVAMFTDWFVRVAFFFPHYLRGKWTKYKAV